MIFIRSISIAIAMALCLQCEDAADATIVRAKERVIDAVWQYHLTVVKAGVAARNSGAGTIDLAEFGRSVDAVEALTRIPSNTGTRLGRMPMPDLPQTIRMWERWYADNRHKLDISIDGSSLRLKK
jgi:hypothetical protein